MNFGRLFFVKPLAVILVIIFISLPLAVAAQEFVEVPEKIEQTPTGTFEEGSIAGKADATGNPIWILAGAGCGVLGILGAILFPPNPPVEKLVGKSSDYVLGYTKGYKSKSKMSNLQYAIGGYAAYLVVYFATDGFGQNKD